MGRKPSLKTTNNTVKIQRKNEVRMRYRHGQRRALAISDYLLLSATQQHREATEFVIKLEEKYPNKKDVRKTQEFRNWQRTQLDLLNKQTIQATDKPAAIEDSTTSKKEMVLRIPLIDTNAKESPLVSTMAGEEDPLVSTMPGEEDQLVSIFDQIPSHIMNELIGEIRADPNLNAIMNDFDLHEEVISEGNVFDINLDIDIDIGEPLEEELNRLL